MNFLIYGVSFLPVLITKKRGLLFYQFQAPPSPPQYLFGIWQHFLPEAICVRQVSLGLRQCQRQFNFSVLILGRYLHFLILKLHMKIELINLTGVLHFLSQQELRSHPLMQKFWIQNKDGRLNSLDCVERYTVWMCLATLLDYSIRMLNRGQILQMQMPVVNR